MITDREKLLRKKLAKFGMFGVIDKLDEIEDYCKKTEELKCY